MHILKWIRVKFYDKCLLIFLIFSSGKLLEKTFVLILVLKSNRFSKEDFELILHFLNYSYFS